jgi:GrpB-like predicted nucleotidyltransferase (UPF0157 family)
MEVAFVSPVWAARLGVQTPRFATAFLGHWLLVPRLVAVSPFCFRTTPLHADMKVIIEPHNPEWKAKFLKVKENLQKILHDVSFISIEHVGSTAIPGLKAKPVLDIDIIVHPASLEPARLALATGRYIDCGEMNIPGRFAFREPGYGRFDAAHGTVKDDRMRHNTYVIVEGALSLRNHLDVRRVLLEDESLRNEYSQLKSELQKREFDDIGQYVTAKSDILYRILQKAGWSSEDLQSVMDVNK